LKMFFFDTSAFLFFQVALTARFSHVMSLPFSFLA
jgi:hypothetical protein